MLVYAIAMLCHAIAVPLLCLCMPLPVTGLASTAKHSCNVVTVGVEKETDFG